MFNRLLIDGNSIAHANHNAAVLTVGGLQVQAIFGFLKSLRALCARNPKAQPVVLWDGSSVWRREVYADYKGNRKPLNAKEAAKKEAFKRQMPLLEYGLSTLGVMQVRSPAHEADDLAALMVSIGNLKGLRQLLVSGDRDWLQLVNASTEWFDPIRDNRVTQERFFEATGYTSCAEFLQGKALMGDRSDNIPGVGGIADKGAPLFIARWRSVEAFFAAVDAGQYTPEKKAEQNLASATGRATFARNMKLMDLNAAPPPVAGELIVRTGPADMDRFLRFCERLAFISILRESDDFLQTINPRLSKEVVHVGSCD